MKSPKKHEAIMPAVISVIVLISVQASLSNNLVFGPKNYLAALEILLLIGVIFSHPRGIIPSSALRRTSAFILIGIISAANITSLILVISHLIAGSHIDGHSLILSAIAIYVTNIIIFGLWYWELDSPGLSGYNEPERGPDFLFPQKMVSNIHPALDNWVPRYFDYLYISLTNATAFSPTDAMPLTTRTKTLMSIQSLASVAVIALVATRAVNILG